MLFLHRTLRAALLAGFLLVPSTLTLVALDANEAQACMNEVRRRTSPDVRTVQRAEETLERGDHRGALKVLFGAFPDLGTRKSVNGNYALQQRAITVAALAISRSQGGYARGAQAEPLGGAAEREANIAWALEQLGRYASGYKGVGQLTMAMAEIRGRHGDEEAREEARQELEKAAKKKWPLAPEAWAVLADLRKAGGDEAGAKKAKAAGKKAEKVRKSIADEANAEEEEEGKSPRSRSKKRSRKAPAKTKAAPRVMAF